ncbi:substrate-binding domain-containing protein [Paenibacillus sp. LHD-117]|uniref:substrate-binding domain-containing protein n=1 Tax=Paenibacillus sp. LHD-117 TaxID=3071412 RepID=UPI0027E13B7A|nr:substrate-binding domain-containing protein [Paenibacillus sp. LHD-117]MDQ6422446.1 substrate-binding domain-containing protein [Paenibacillus sp. LHD-117]
MKRSKSQALWAVILLALLGAASFYSFSRVSDDDKLDIVVILKSTDDSIEFWQVLEDGIDVAAQEFGANVDKRGSDTEADVDGQIALLEEAIKDKPDAIVLAANDFNRLVPASEKVKKSGIRLFVVDSGINADIAQSVVATDNRKAGELVGLEMLRQLNGKSKVAIINYVRTAASLNDREQGVRAVLDGNPDIVTLETYYADGLEENAYEIAKQVMTEHPDVRGIIGLNEPTSAGAGRAIRDMRLQGQVKLIGFDSSMNEIKLLEEGIMQATVIQRPFQMGYLSIKTAVSALRGKKVPDVIDTGSLIITKQNMYEEENQKLLFPFYDR